MPVPRLFTAAALAAALLLVGCVGGRGWNPFADKTVAAALSPEATLEEVVAHVNANTERCTAWRSTDVKVTSNQVAIKMDAMMAVESPRRFRMLASTMAGTIDCADLGSNEDRMWFWTRPVGDEPQYVYTCAHQDVAAAQRRMPIPFRPDWLMEVLGVIPLDPTQFQTEPTGDAGQFRLTSLQAAPDGSQVRRVVTVDGKRGVVTSHELWTADDGGARLVAQAKLSDHRRDETSGVTLPHKIQLLYPEASAEMTLAIKNIEVNPATVSQNTWQPTVAADCPFRDLASGEVVTLDQVKTF